MGFRMTRSVALAVLALAPVMAWGAPATPRAAAGSRSATADAPATSQPSTTVTPTTTPTTVTPTTITPTTIGRPTTTEPIPRSFTLAFTGDVLLHSRVNAVAAANAADDDHRDHDYRPMLEPIRRWIESADRAICHLEVNLSADGTRLSSYPSFRGPGQVAFDLADLGYDSCTVASNHILDKGLDGVSETLGVLDSAGLRPIGAARSPAEARDQPLFTVEGVTVAHLAYTYWFNGIPLPDDAPWTSNLIDEDRILADAARARRDGAEYIVVSLHWGQQYRHEPDAQQRDLGPRLLASPDIDLIVGHHAHVVQPIENHDGEWLIYGLGNLLSNSHQAERRDELLVTATVTETTDHRFTTDLTVVPLHLDHGTLTVHPTRPADRPSTIDPALDDQLDASWNRVTGLLLGDSGQPNLVLPASARPTGDSPR